VSGFAVRNEQEAQNEMEPEWNAYTASTWIDQPGMFYFYAQLLGGGEIEEMHEVLNNFQAAWKGA
jgi:hypothetical protein